MSATISSTPLDHDFGGRVDEVIDRAVGRLPDAIRDAIYRRQT